MKHVVVIGGANMDLCGRPAGRLAPRDSNPGTVTARPGGVGRNIARDLRLLGVEVSLIAPIGGDRAGAELLQSCRELGIDMSMSPVFPGERSSCYLYVTDENGEMQLAVSDMEIMKRITPECLAPHLEQINRADAVLLDGNLPERTLLYAAQHCTAPLCADPVSAAKAPRLRGVLHRLALLKPNALEAAALTGLQDPEQAAAALLEAGVQRVFVSLGAGGMLAAQGDRLLRLPCEELPVVNTTGAGDAATAALVWARLQELDLEQSARAALRAAALVCAACGTDSPALAQLPGAILRKA